MEVLKSIRSPLKRSVSSLLLHSTDLAYLEFRSTHVDAWTPDSPRLDDWDRNLLGLIPLTGEHRHRNSDRLDEGLSLSEGRAFSPSTFYLAERAKPERCLSKCLRDEGIWSYATDRERQPSACPSTASHAFFDYIPIIQRRISSKDPRWTLCKHSLLEACCYYLRRCLRTSFTARRRTRVKYSSTYIYHFNVGLFINNTYVIIDFTESIALSYQSVAHAN